VHPVFSRGRRYYEPMENLRSASLAGTYYDPIHQDEKLKVAGKIMSFFPFTLRYSCQQISNSINGGILLYSSKARNICSGTLSIPLITCFSKGLSILVADCSFRAPPVEVKTGNGNVSSPGLIAKTAYYERTVMLDC